MQFLVIAYDGTDEGAPARRMKVRDQHIALVDRLRDEGHARYTAAILDDDDAMIGSMLVMDYPSRAELDGWLAVEPYVAGDVWRDVQIKPCRVGPSFA